MSTGGHAHPDPFAAAGSTTMAAKLGGWLAAAVAAGAWLLFAADDWLPRVLAAAAGGIAVGFLVRGLAADVADALATGRFRSAFDRDSGTWASAARGECRADVEMEARAVEAGGRRADTHFLGTTAFTTRYRATADAWASAAERRLRGRWLAAMLVSVGGLVAATVPLTPAKAQASGFLELAWPAVAGLVGTAVLAGATFLRGRAWADLFDRWVDWAKDRDAAALRQKLAVPPTPSEPVLVREERRVVTVPKPEPKPVPLKVEPPRVPPPPPVVVIVPPSPPPPPSFKLSDWVPPPDDNDDRG